MKGSPLKPNRAKACRQACTSSLSGRRRRAAQVHDAAGLPAREIRLLAANVADVPDVPGVLAADDRGTAPSGVSEQAAPAALELQAGLRPHAPAADDILRFPRGPAAGDCMHAVFETIDFTDPTGWDEAIDAALAMHPQSLADGGGSGARSN